MDSSLENIAKRFFASSIFKFRLSNIISLQNGYRQFTGQLFLGNLRELSFEEKCRIGAVSRSFRRMSKISISQTKSLWLDEPEFTNLPVTSLSKIFDLCRENLEVIWVPGKFIATLAEFSFPQLARIRLELDEGHGFDWIDVILANNPAAKESSLALFENHSGQFASTGATYVNLTLLDVSPKRSDGAPIVDGKFFRLLSGRCPNLKQLSLFGCQLHDEGRNALKEFLAHCPTTLDELNFGFVSGLNFFEMEWFWRMESLQELTILKVSDSVSQRGDDFLVKVSNSFPRLRILQVNCLIMTNRGVGALASLNDLILVNLFANFGDFEASLFQLAQNGKLQQAFVNCWISPSAFLTIVSKCPNLAMLFLHGVRNVETPAAAAELVTSLGRWNRKREIGICFVRQKDLWESSEVASALMELKEKAELIVEFNCIA